MPKIAYLDSRKMSAGTQDIIERANEIINEYAGQGFDLTLRQLYYQFVARALLPNTQTEYKRLGDIINTARLTGLVDWNAITDRTRFLREESTWSSPASIIKVCAEQYAIDKWANQPYRPEVWIEKDALVGVIELPCNTAQVPFFSCRGYVSQSEMWAAARRIFRHSRNGQNTVIIHLGDHDPSGIDMARDMQDRLHMFLEREGRAGAVEVRRIALNMDQVQQYTPPPNPAKITDSRYEGYMREYGGESWELDALEPRALSTLIRNTIYEYRDIDLWEAMIERENEEKSVLEAINEQYEDVRRFVRG